METWSDAGNLELINSIASGFYRLKGPTNRDNLDEKKAKRLLQEFRDAIGDDPIEVRDFRKREREKARVAYEHRAAARRTQAKRLEDINAELIPC